MFEFNINISCTLYNCDVYVYGWMWTDCGVPQDNHVTEIMRNNNYINAYLAAANGKWTTNIRTHFWPWINSPFSGLAINWKN